jgi:hypothetical protein
VPPFWLAQPSAAAKTSDEKHKHKTAIKPTKKDFFIT